jgi:hypothetical protein
MQKKTQKHVIIEDYDGLLSGVASLIDEARRASAQSVNAIITATYWEIGRRIVDNEQGGRRRAGYGEALLKRLSADLVNRFGRGFSERNLEQMRNFYLAWPISQTLSAKFQPANSQTSSAELSVQALSDRFPLPWSAYVRLLSVKNGQARAFYEQEALRGG